MTQPKLTHAEAWASAADEVRAALDKVRKEQMAGAMVVATELGELQKQLAQLCEAQVASGGEATVRASERKNETRERLRLEAAPSGSARSRGAARAALGCVRAGSRLRQIYIVYIIF